MPASWFLAILMFVFPATAYAKCAGSDISSPGRISLSSLSPGTEIAAIRTEREFSCTVHFTIDKPASIVLEAVALPRNKKARDLPDIPMDLRLFTNAETYPVGKRLRVISSRIASDRGRLFRLDLKPGDYSLSFPPENEKLPINSFREKLDISYSKVTLAIVGAEPLEVPPIELTPQTGTSLALTKTVFMNMPKISATLNTDASLHISLTPKKLTGHKHETKEAVMYVNKIGGKYPSAREVIGIRKHKKNNEEKFEFSTHLTSGSYIIGFHLNSSNDIISHRDFTSYYDLAFDLVTPTPRDPLLERLDTIFEAGGFRYYIEPIEISSYSDVRKSGNTREIRLRDFQDFARGETSRMNDWRYRTSSSGNYDRNRIPEYIVLLKIHDDSMFFWKQDDFIRKYGQSIFDNIFSQLSLALGVSRTKIGIVAPAHCKDGLVYGSDLILTSLGGVGCSSAAMGSMEVKRTSEANFVSPKIADTNDFFSSVDKFIKYRFAGADLQYLGKGMETFTALLARLGKSMTSHHTCPTAISTIISAGTASTKSHEKSSMKARKAKN
ncbi:hypothetical protein PX860_15560 [Agrobacterium leguminum]|uniref:hypothetical protein n=1 Tax=Agrobacterium leguminum TaxID=2792015 RepID=UPI00272CAD4F|nr:hypothetical protein [Agrobacterium leguminum]WLD98537.1 hypothetical protein PX860_15560 [Agrobacterium leguminum]